MPSLPDAPEQVHGWAVDRFDLSAGEFHALDVPDDIGRSVWISTPPAKALVLGSTQEVSIVDADAAERRGVDVVRRRSGGGAVLVVPGELCWIDLVIGHTDLLWDDDVGRAMHWVGDLWKAALAALDVVASVHRGSMVRTPTSDLACFGGLGPGEVVGAGGAKMVGISQRRTRSWARFQTAALVGWDPDELVALLTSGTPGMGAELAEAACGTGRSPADLETALLGRLPRF